MGLRRWFPELPVNVGSAEGVMRSLPEAVELTKAGRFLYSATRPPSLRLGAQTHCLQCYKLQGETGKAVLCYTDPFVVLEVAF